MNQNSKSWGNGYQNTNYARSGLLSNNHLQNLDREIKLLRHKREMIKREQQMLTVESDFDRKRQYDEQTNHNTSNMYDNSWQTPPPKRANNRRQLNPWMSSSQGSVKPNNSNSISRKYIPSLLSKKIDPPLFPTALKPIAHPTQKNTVAPRPFRPINERKDLCLTKVTKKKSKAPPNKLNSYPVEERKNLVSTATGSQPAKAKPTKLPLDPDAMTLRDDRVPNKHITGRLELALGSIVKEIRCSYRHNEKFKTLITHPAHRRIMKQAVRERIRSVMINKTVGSIDDIVNQYRKKFPKRSDKDIVELVFNSEHPKLMTIIETDDPEEFFKKNITAILEKKVQEMSSNLLKMYLNARNKNTLAYTKAAKEANSNVGEPVVELSESTLNNEMTMKVLRGITGKYVTIEESNVLTSYYTDLIEEILEEKLPEYLEQCTAVFRKIFQIDQQFKTIKFMVTKQIKDEMKAKYADTDIKTDKKDLVKKEMSQVIKMQQKVLTKNTVMEEQVVIENNETKEETVTENNETKAETVTENNATQEERLIENNGTQKEMPSENTQKELLTENVIGKEINIESDKTEEIKVVTPVSTTTEKSSSTLMSATPTSIVTQQSCDTINPTAKRTESSSTTFKSPITVSTPLPMELSYYVKLIGRPKLPNRAVICDFLNNYRPNSIKKHKSISNLLVIGFINKEDYDRILTANETIFDDVTIFIKPSEKVNPAKDGRKEGKANVNDKVEQELKDTNGISKETTSRSVDEEQKLKDSNEISKETTSRSVDEDQELKDATGISKETTSRTVEEEQKLKDATGISKETTSRSDDEEQELKDATGISKETTSRTVEEEQKLKDATGISKQTTSVDEEQDDKDFIGKELDDQLSDLLTTLKEADNETKSNKKIQVHEVNSEGAQEPDKANISSKESQNLTSVRSSSRLRNVTSTTIKTCDSNRPIQ